MADDLFLCKKMVNRKHFITVFASLIFLTLICVSSVSAEFNFAGYTKYQNGTNMSNVNVSLEVTYWSGSGAPSEIIALSNLSDSNGFFNLTINDTWDNSSYMYNPSIVKYNGTSGTGAYAEYIGQSLPSFDGFMFADLGAITFYLKQAINIDLSVIGNTHEGDAISYSNSYSLGEDYKTGFDVVNESSLYGLMYPNKALTYSYVNNSDCLVILNSSRASNTTFCNLNITNIVDLERYNWGSGAGQNDTYYFVNNTRIERCFVNTGSLSCVENITFSELGYSAVNYSSVQGITIGAKTGDNTYLFVSGVNSSGDHIVGKFYPNLTYVESYSITYGGAGKMSTNNGYGNIYFTTNNSGLYQLYYCYLDSYEDLTCGPDSTFANFSVGEIVTGISSFGSQLTFASGVSKNMTLLSTETNSYQFMYQVKDSRLGYSVKEEWNNPLDSVSFSLPVGRNYSLMIYPRNGPSFPATLDLNSLAVGSNISLGNRNATISSVGGGLYVNLSNANMSLEFNQLPGYIKWNASASEQNFTNLTIIAYLFEGGNMVYKGGTLPANMGQWQTNRVTDSYNLTTGRFNMTLPASVLGTDLLLFATSSVNNSGTLVYYGGFKSVSLTYGESATETNFTLYPLVGQDTNITIGYETQTDASRFLTKQRKFNVTANGSAVSQAHVEIEIDYSSFSGSNISFSWMAPVGTGDGGVFYLPVFNNSIKSIQIFSSNYAPLKKKISQSELQQDMVYINLSAFENKNPNGEELNDSLIEMMIYINKDDGSCSVPYPDLSCYPFDPESDEEVNPFGLVLGGGKLDFEIKKTDSNITVRYINVDLLASGPPDAIFDEAGNSSEGGLEEAWRFGSLGPEIYDYVLIGIPYNTTAITSSITALVNITKFYGESWDAPEWEMGVNGTSALDGTEYEDYKEGDYVDYTDGGGASCSTTDSDLSQSLCYRNTTLGMLWFKIPHFSGIGPNIVGNSISNDENNNNNGGGGGGSGAAGLITYTASNEQFSQGYTKVLVKGEKIKFSVSNQSHTVTLNNLTTNSAIIIVNSTPQTATLLIGESKKFDVDNDKYYDLLVKLNSIANSRANLTVLGLHEMMYTNDQGLQNKGGEKDSEGSGSDLADDPDKVSSQLILAIVIVAIIIVAVILIIFYFRRKR